MTGDMVAEVTQKGGAGVGVRGGAGGGGDWAVITQYRLMRNPLEKEAFRQSGLTAFVLTKVWASHRYWEKAAQVVRWWPRIMEQAGLVEGGAVFEVPWRFSGKGKFKALRL